MLFGCPYFLCRKSVLLVSKVNIPTNLCFLSISCIYLACREISPQNMQNLSENTFQKFTWWTLSLRIRIYLNFHQEFCVLGCDQGAIPGHLLKQFLVFHSSNIIRTFLFKVNNSVEPLIGFFFGSLQWSFSHCHQNIIIFIFLTIVIILS